MIFRSAEIVHDTQVKEKPASHHEEIEVHKDMSIDELIQASEEVHKVAEDVPKEEEMKVEVRY